ISGREEVLGLACGAVASGGYYPDQGGDGELTLNVSQTLPTAIGTPHRMPEMPVSGREHVLHLASGAVATGGYHPDRAGDGDLSLRVFQTLPTAIVMPYPTLFRSISGREDVLGLACGAVASGGYCRHRAGDGELALHVSQRLPTAIGMPYRMPEMPVSG